MIQRNKGDTQDFEKSVLIPFEEVKPLKESLLRVLTTVKLEKSKSVQREDVKNIYKLLEYFSIKD